MTQTAWNEVLSETWRRVRTTTAARSADTSSKSTPTDDECRLCGTPFSSDKRGLHATESAHVAQEFYLEQAVRIAVGVCRAAEETAKEGSGDLKKENDDRSPDVIRVPFGSSRVYPTAYAFLQPLFSCASEFAMEEHAARTRHSSSSDADRFSWADVFSRSHVTSSMDRILLFKVFCCLHFQPFVFGERLHRCHARVTTPASTSSRHNPVSFRGVAMAFVASQTRAAGAAKGYVHRDVARLDEAAEVLLLPKHKVSAFLRFVTSPSSIRHAERAAAAAIENRLEAVTRTAPVLHDILRPITCGHRGLEYQRIECYGDHNFGSFNTARLRILFALTWVSDGEGALSAAPAGAALESWNLTSSSATVSFEFLRQVVESNENMDGVASMVRLSSILVRSLGQQLDHSLLDGSTTSSVTSRISVLKSASSVKSGGDAIESVLGQLRMMIRSLRAAPFIGGPAVDDLGGGVSTSYVVEILEEVLESLLDLIVLHAVVRSWHHLVAVACDIVTGFPSASAKLVSASSSTPMSTILTTLRGGATLTPGKVCLPTPRRTMRCRIAAPAGHSLPPRRVLHTKLVTYNSQPFNNMIPAMQNSNVKATRYRIHLGQDALFAHCEGGDFCRDFAGAPALSVAPSSHCSGCAVTSADKLKLVKDILAA